MSRALPIYTDARNHRSRARASGAAWSTSGDRVGRNAHGGRETQGAPAVPSPWLIPQNHQSMSSSRQTDELGRVHKAPPICSSPAPARYSQFAHNPQHLVLTSSTRSRTIAPTHEDCPMPGARLHMSPTATALTCLPAPDHVFLRLQLLARLTLSLRQHYHIRCTSHDNA